MDALVKEAFALLGVGLFVIGLRLAVRVSAVGMRHLQADDYLMMLAAVGGPHPESIGVSGLTRRSGRVLD